MKESKKINLFSGILVVIGTFIFVIYKQGLAAKLISSIFPVEVPYLNVLTPLACLCVVITIYLVLRPFLRSGPGQ